MARPQIPTAGGSYTGPAAIDWNAPAAIGAGYGSGGKASIPGPRVRAVVSQAPGDRTGQVVDFTAITDPSAGGMSTGAKVAIGVAAAGVLGAAWWIFSK